MAFRFKQFTVNDDRSTMKVGTDAVLLGAWVDVKGAKRILDIGTGCGVIALMIAQRTGEDSTITALEPDPASFQQATENVALSPWPEKVEVVEMKAQDYSTLLLFDLIVSNPPFFQNSLLPPGKTRQVARHTETLSFDDLLQTVKRLLSPTGKFAVILPTNEGNQFTERALTYGLCPIRMTAFYTRDGKAQERWLLEFLTEKNTVVREKLVLYEGGDEWSTEYRELTGEFYL